MILEGYLLYQEYCKNRLKYKNPDRDIIFISNDIDSDSSDIGVLIFLFILFFISIIIAIVCAYFLYSCIRNECIGFFMFVLIVILLNVPFVNIAIFIILLILWMTKCRKKGACSSSN